MRSQIFNLIKDQTTLSWEQIAANIIVSGILGFLIFISYMVSHRGTIYSKKFNVSLVALTVLTSMVMTVIGNNVALSLGMVGALSIVRFRNAVKDSSDLAYLFWSISMGIITGAGLFELALLLSICVTILIVALDMVPTFRAPCILVVSGDKETEEKAVMACVKKFAKTAKIRSRNITKHGTEWIVEMQAKEEEKLVKAVSALNGVISVNLMTHDGEVRF